MAALTQNMLDIPLAPVCRYILGGRDLNNVYILVAGDAALECPKRNQDQIILIRAHGGLAFGIQHTDNCQPNSRMSPFYQS